MYEMFALISCVIFSSVALTLNLDSDLSGTWTIEGVEQSLSSTITCKKSDKVGSDLVSFSEMKNNSERLSVEEAFKKSIVYDINADGEFSGYFAMSIVYLNNEPNMFWYRNKENVDLESNAIMRTEGNKLFLGADLGADKELAVMTKIN